MTQAKRADVALVEAGLFESRSKASAAIAAGLVTADGRLISKSSTPIAPDAVIVAEPAFPWVGRGGLKLAAGLDAFGIDPSGLVCLDVGASTGGFCDVLVARGARHVTAVDVGRDQFHASLRHHPRIALHESCDARTLDMDRLGRPFDLLVCDVSFISLRLILPPVLRLAAAKARAVLLVKPQFEAGPALVRKGVVRDASVHDTVCEGMRAFVTALGWRVMGIVPSPIEGGEGNREFLLGATRADV